MTGREAYERARRRAQARKPADPQTIRGGGTGLNDPRPCTCTHGSAVHNIGTRKGREVRTACTVAEAAGPCPCREYTPEGAGAARLRRRWCLP